MTNTLLVIARSEATKQSTYPGAERWIARSARNDGRNILHMTTDIDAELIEEGRKLFAGDWQFVFMQTQAPGSCPPSSCGGCGSRGGCSSGN